MIRHCKVLLILCMYKSVAAISSEHWMMHQFSVCFSGILAKVASFHGNPPKSPTSGMETAIYMDPCGEPTPRHLASLCFIEWNRFFSLNRRKCPNCSHYCFTLSQEHYYWLLSTTLIHFHVVLMIIFKASFMFKKVFAFIINR